MNCPFLTFTGRPVAAAASRRSVWRARNAGTWSRSTISASGLAWIVSWMSVVTGRPVSALTRAKTFIPSTRPGPRKLDPDVRLALSNEALKIRGTPSRAADFDQAMRDPQRHVARLHHARAGDQCQRAIPSDLDIADRDRVGGRHLGLLACPSIPVAVHRTRSPDSYRATPSLASGTRAGRKRRLAEAITSSAAGMTSTLQPAAGSAAV